MVSSKQSSIKMHNVFGLFFFYESEEHNESVVCLSQRKKDAHCGELLDVIRC